MTNDQRPSHPFGLSDTPLDASSGIALNVQLADLFRYQVLSGVWPAGHRLDNFEVLAARYRVARITVRQAVARLVQEGLLSAQRGRGTVVLSHAGSAAMAAPRVGGTWTDEAQIRLVHKQRVTTLPDEFRGDFGVFDSYVEIAKLHVVRDAPFAMVRLFVAADIYRHFPRRAAETSKLLRLMFVHGGESVSQLRQRLTVEPADLVQAQHLHCAVGSPVARILRQLHGADRRVAYSALSWYRGESFEMDITLPRDLVEDSSPALIAPRAR